MQQQTSAEIAVFEVADWNSQPRRPWADVAESDEEARELAYVRDLLGLESDDEASEHDEARLSLKMKITQLFCAD